MATTTITEVEQEVPQVEVTSNVGSDESEPEKKTSKFANLRRRITNGNSDGSRKPSDAKWRQQQLPACRPVFSAKHVFVIFLVLALVFLALGIAFTVVLSDLREMEVDYTQCTPITPEIQAANFTTCDQYIKCKTDCVLSDDAVCSAFVNASGITRNDSCQQLPICRCQVNITLNQALRPTVHVYYGIRNFYQNHRRYLNSIDLIQLHGGFLRNPPSDDCRPLITTGGKPYLPCGLIGNSWFNDSIEAIQDISNQSVMYDIDRTNIAWDTDRNTRFNGSSNPEVVNATQIATPPNWPTSILNVPDAFNNESLIVWFRVSAFPWFRKLFGRVKQNGVPVEMPASTYTITIIYSYPVTDFNGAKSVILAEISWLGGRNLFLGAAYIVVAVLLVIAGLVLLIIHLTCSKWKESDRNFLNRSY